MSKGPGRVQRAISTLIEGDPDGAWTTADICRVVYPGDEIDKKHRVAVLYALRHMTLPGTWTVRRLSRAGVEFCLYDPCRDEAQTRVSWMEMMIRSPRRYDPNYRRWKKREDFMVERAHNRAAEARRWRDATPLEKIKRDMSQIRMILGAIKSGGGDGNDAFARQLIEDYTALEAERAKLAAPGR